MIECDQVLNTLQRLIDEPIRRDTRIYYFSFAKI